MMTRIRRVMRRVFGRKLSTLFLCTIFYSIVLLMIQKMTAVIGPIVNRDISKLSKESYRYSHPFNYIHTPSKMCGFKDSLLDPLLVILVKSNVRNFDNRIAIRSTWGNISDTAVRVAFLLGNSPFLRDFIKMEHALYNDIIQENFLDNYYNNTLKTIMGFNWCLDNCRKTAYLFFVDDGYLVNTRLILEYVRKIKPKSIFAGCIWTGAVPNRNKWSKWFVSEKDFPDKVWPPYPSGGSYLISRDYALQIRHGFRIIKHLHVDDVNLGIIANKLEIKLTNDGRFHPYYNLEIVQELFSIHQFVSPRKLIIDWESLKGQLGT